MTPQWLVQVTVVLEHPTLKHAQNMVQGKPLSRQLHRLELQGGSLLQPHLIISNMKSGAGLVLSGRAVGQSDLLVMSLFHPKSSGFSGGGLELGFRHRIVWKWALFTFSMNASLVGGRAAKLGEDE